MVYTCHLRKAQLIRQTNLMNGVKGTEVSLRKPHDDWAGVCRREKMIRQC